MQIIFMYIQNHYVKNNYMPLHKLNQAKKYKLSIGKKKKKTCTFPIFFFLLKSIPAHLQTPDMRVHTDTRLCTSCSHWNIQTNTCLFGWCEAVAPCSVYVCTCNYTFSKNTRTHTQKK